MKLKLLSLIAIFFSLQVAMAQRVVTGLVTDSGANDPIVGATVKVVGTTTGTVTNDNGAFSLNVPDKATTLEVSIVGYTTQQVSIDGINNVKVSLKEGATLGEFVVTALGVVEKKEKLSYATQKLDAKEFNQSRFGDVSKQLAGQVPGLSITSGNGSGVSSSRIVLRGEFDTDIIKL